jgi:hypothetical protein
MCKIKAPNNTGQIKITPADKIDTGNQKKK